MTGVAERGANRAGLQSEASAVGCASGTVGAQDPVFAADPACSGSFEDLMDALRLALTQPESEQGSTEAWLARIRRHFQPRPAAMRTWALNGRNPGAHRNGADT